MNPTMIGYVLIGLALVGAYALTRGLVAWLEDRFTRDGWRIRRRWDHPGAEVILPDGRMGALETIYRGESPGDMAVVIFEDAEPEWMLRDALSPVPVVASEPVG